MKIMDWQELVRLTQGEPFIVDRVRLPAKGVVIEGCFELPALARLTADDQVFVMAFVKSEGVIKEMEKVFGVSYPTIKNRLSRIAGLLQLVETVTPSHKQDILDSLEKGEISAQEAIERLSQ